MKTLSLRKLAKALGVSHTAIVKWRKKFLEPLSSMKTEDGIYETLSPESIALLFVVKQLRFYKMPEELIEAMLERLHQAFSSPVEDGKKIMLVLAQIPNPVNSTLYVNIVIDTEESMKEAMERLKMPNRIYDISELLSRIKKGNLSNLGKTIDWEVA